MIITSIAAALLAAVTGMTTVRAPGGNEQQTQAKPTYAWEMTVADIGDSMSFLRSLRSAQNIHLDHLPLKAKERAKLEQQVRTTFTTIIFGLRETNLRPTKMSYYNVYNVEEMPSKFAQESTYKQNIEYSVITFSDENDNELHFVDTCGSEAFHHYTAAENVVAFDSNVFDSGNLGVQIISDAFVSAGLSDLTYVKNYEEVLNMDNLIIDTTTVDMMGSNQSGTMGMGFAWWAPWNDWEVIGYILRSRKNRHDVIRPGLENVAMVANDSIISNPIAGILMKYTLEETGTFLGNSVLNANQVNASMNAAMSMSYNEMLQLNDLNIVY